MLFCLLSYLQRSSSVRMDSLWPSTPACCAVRNSNPAASSSATLATTTRTCWVAKSINARTATSPPTKKPVCTTTWRCMRSATKCRSNARPAVKSSISRRRCSRTVSSTTNRSRNRPRPSHRRFLPLPRPRRTNASFANTRLLSKGCSIAICWPCTVRASHTSAWNAARVSAIRRS